MTVYGLCEFLHFDDVMLQLNGVAVSGSGDISSSDEPSDNTHKKAKVRTLCRL